MTSGRWGRAVAGLAVVLLGVAGCQAPARTDGDLVDDWRALPAPSYQRPAVGDCLDSQARMAWDLRFYRATPIDCGETHALEVVLVGTVDGDGASGAEPPEAGSAAYKAVFAACSKAVDDYVGGDWHDGALGVNVQLPTKAPWAGGDRGYVCTVFGSAAADDSMAFRKGSLKGALPAAALRCLDVIAEPADDGWYSSLAALKPIDCAQPHGGEYVGSVQLAGATLPDADALDKTLLNSCWAETARYMGLSQSALARRREVEVTWDVMDEGHWQTGDHYTRCYAVVAPKSPVHASLKNLGTAKLPT